jgi:hypothetical protein
VMRMRIWNLPLTFSQICMPSIDLKWPTKGSTFSLWCGSDFGSSFPLWWWCGSGRAVILFFTVSEAFLVLVRQSLYWLVGDLVGASSISHFRAVAWRAGLFYAFRAFIGGQLLTNITCTVQERQKNCRS